MTPQVARGSPIRGSLCSSWIVSIAASPGATIFGPPEKPAKKCGSVKPSVIRASASRNARSTRAGATEPGTVPSCAWAARSSASCCTSSQAARTSGAEYRVELVARAGAVAPRGHDQPNAAAGQLVEEHRQDGPGGERPRDVADAHRHGGAARNELGQRGAEAWAPHAVPERPLGVCQPGGGTRPQDVHAVRHLDLEAPPAEVQAHRAAHRPSVGRHGLRVNLVVALRPRRRGRCAQRLNGALAAQPGRWADQSCAAGNPIGLGAHNWIAGRLDRACAAPLGRCMHRGRGLGRWAHVQGAGLGLRPWPGTAPARAPAAGDQPLVKCSCSSMVPWSSTERTAIDCGGEML